jgi:hypothetical protein
MPQHHRAFEYGNQNDRAAVPDRVIFFRHYLLRVLDDTCKEPAQITMRGEVESAVLGCRTNMIPNLDITGEEIDQ